MSENVENQERCFYKIAHITVATSGIECQTWFLINAKQII